MAPLFKQPDIKALLNQVSGKALTFRREPEPTISETTVNKNQGKAAFLGKFRKTNPRQSNLNTLIRIAVMLNEIDILRKISEDIRPH
jgi:hypothetical protein